jgi:hypothetical protein
MAVFMEATLKELRSSWKNRSCLTAEAFFAGLVLVSIAAAPAFAQEETSYVYPNQEVRIANLPSLTAPSTNPSAVLATAVETILHDKGVCCGKDSALEDAVRSNPPSLKELSVKLQGRHVLSDGRHVMVNAEYVPQSSITSDRMIGALLEQHAPLIEWKSHLYVLYGAIFDKTLYSTGRAQFAIRKLFLRDPRFSDERSEVEFNRGADDWGKIEGFMTLSVVRQ